jgi:hypothetical protein
MSENNGKIFRPEGARKSLRFDEKSVSVKQPKNIQGGDFLCVKVY